MRIMNTYCLSDLKNLDFGIMGINSKEKHCEPGFQLIQRKGRSLHGFLYVLDGNAEYITHNNEKIAVGKNDIMYIPKNCKYESKASISECYCYIIINMDIIDNTKSDIIFTNDLSIILNSNSSYYQNIFKEINNAYMIAGMASNIKCKYLVYEMLYHLALDLFKNELNLNKYSKIYPGILYLEENCYRSINMYELANASHLSISHFRRLFAAYFGMPPTEYINKLKIKKACELLKSGIYTVSEAAEEVGIANIYYFSRLFKKITGVSPKNMMK